MRMGPIASLRPRRNLAFPFVLVSFPLLWFVMRDADISGVGRPVTDVLPRVAGLSVAALVVSYAVAVLLDAVLDLEAESVPGWARPLARPSDGSLATFASVTLALGAYIVAGSAVTFPGWFETLASAVGVVLGWPLLLVVLGTVAVSNAFVPLPISVEIVLVALGVSISAAWLFLLSGWLAGLLKSESATRTGP